MRSLAVALLALLTAGCSGITAGPRAATPDPLRVEPTGSPFVLVTAGPVSGLVPDGWSIAPINAESRSGFVAGPSAGTGRRLPLGLAAAWVDATRVGVPSDFYYLAATGPALRPLGAHPSCIAHRTAVYVDHSPAFLTGTVDSPGDFVARVHGTCDTRDEATRWSSFVAAPGFGPARQLGIPSSGLYVVTAMTPAGPGAAASLAALMAGVRFGDAQMGDFVRAVGPASL